MLKHILGLFFLCVFMVGTPLIAADFGKAEAAYKKGDYQAARKLSQAYLDKNPKGESARQARLYLADLQQELAAAVDAYRRLIDEKAADTVARSAQKAIAERFYLVSRYSEARENYARFLELYPADKQAGEVRFWLATCYVLLNDIDKGMKLFEEVAASSDKVRKTWAKLAIAECLIKLGRPSEAETLLKKMAGTVAAEDLGNLIYFHLGECYEKQKKVEQAAGAYRRVVRDYPSSFEMEEAKRRLELLRLENPRAVGESLIYAVQVGAFSREDNALALAEKLKTKGYPAYAVAEKVRAGGVTLYRVRVGKYKARAEAESQARLLNARENMPGMVVEVGQ